MMKKKSVAILIPTRNRSQFIKGLLNYYEQIGSHHPLYIGDCSDLEHFNAIRSSVDSLNEKVNVNLKHFPQYTRGIIDTCIVIQNLLNFVKEDFAVFAGDDDYFIPKSLDKCVEFLENNNEFTSVHGYGTFLIYHEKN